MHRIGGVERRPQSPGSQGHAPRVVWTFVGTMRAELLDTGEIVEEAVPVEEFRAAEEIWLMNSVRGWMRAVLVD